MVLLTIGLIVFGAVVRVTDSGLGCGNDWPLCDGRIMPPSSNLTAWVEWSHRLFAILIGLIGLVMLGLAWRQRATGNGLVLKATVAAAILFAIQSVLGAMVVAFDLPPTMVTLHLGSAMLLVGALLVAAVGARQIPSVRDNGHDRVTTLAYIATALSLVVILTGALVRGSGATLACSGWPLCNGAILPFAQGELQTVHTVHRFAVVGLGTTLLMLIWYMYQLHDKRILLLAVSAFVGYLLQAAIGALFVLSKAEPFWGVAHVAFACMTWASLVVVSAIETSGVSGPYWSNNRGGIHGSNH
jgi:heme A synthase